jgi:hypothetical protein
VQKVFTLDFLASSLAAATAAGHLLIGQLNDAFSAPVLYLALHRKPRGPRHYLCNSDVVRTNNAVASLVLVMLDP